MIVNVGYTPCQTQRDEVFAHGRKTELLWNPLIFNLEYSAYTVSSRNETSATAGLMLNSVADAGSTISQHLDHVSCWLKWQRKADGGRCGHVQWFMSTGGLPATRAFQTSALITADGITGPLSSLTDGLWDNSSPSTYSQSIHTYINKACVHNNSLLPSHMGLTCG